MAWDFSTDPEFERKLEWMRTFVREEVWPIEAVEDRLTQMELDRINAPLKRRSGNRGCGQRTCHLSSVGRASARSSWGS